MTMRIRCQDQTSHLDGTVASQFALLWNAYMFPVHIILVWLIVNTIIMIKITLWTIVGIIVGAQPWPD